MRQLYIAFLLLLVLTPLGYAQKYEDRAKNFYKYGNYEKALKDYIRLYRRDQENVELLQLIVDCYIFDEEVKDGVMPYLDKLLTLKPEDAKANLSMAKALFHSYKFDQADEWVVKAYNLFSSDAVEEKKECENLRIYIQNAKELVKKPIDITFINVGDRINTSRNEVNPYTVRDESAIFYTSDKRYNSFAGIYYYNVCAAELNGMFFEKGKTIGSYVNSIYDEWVAGITPDGKMLFVHHNRDDEHAMGYAEYKGNYRFDALLPFGDPIDQAGNEYGLWMTESTDTIVFSGDADNGTMDLFYAIRKPDGQFGYARPLPGLVNSDKYNENYPMLTDNGTRLYFCSDNEKSMGGYDIFYSDWDKSANGWGSPVNIGYPLNDTYDNQTISWVQGKRHAYVSAIKPGGEGHRDIYRVVFNDKPNYEAIIKCGMQLYKNKKYSIPDFSPEIIVSDTASIDNVFGMYKATKEKADFVIVLPPGLYDLWIKHPEIQTYKRRIEIPEKWYSNLPEQMNITLNSSSNLPGENAVEKEEVKQDSDEEPEPEENQAEEPEDEE